MAEAAAGAGIAESRIEGGRRADVAASPLHCKPAPVITGQAAKIAILQVLERQVAEADAAVGAAENREAVATARGEALKEGVALMWQRLGCDALGLEELLGEGGVTDTNLMQYLGIIEERVNQLLSVSICL